MNNFNQLALPSILLKTLEKMSFKEPTKIQAETIPVAREGKDIVGTAETGTGKTGAFAIPFSAKLLENSDEHVLVMTPTRELAMQVSNVFKQLLSTNKSIKTALLIGGDSIQKQFKQLKMKPRLVVGTPGRINDHLKRNTLRLRDTRSLVLDETDLMLDMGFDVQIETIIDKLPKERQTLMFSATLPRKIEGMAAKYLKNPVRVSVGKQSAPGKNITQEAIVTTEAEKHSLLLKHLDKREGSIIIFVKTKRAADKLSIKLNSEGHKSCAIHGDLRQSKRERVLKDFRNQKYRIMVATDVAARGIDVPHIRHVINYNLPQRPEDYIHRIGRTARAGEKGEAVSFITKSERLKWNAIECLLDPNAKKERAFKPSNKTSRNSFSKRKPRGDNRSRNDSRPRSGKPPMGRKFR